MPGVPMEGTVAFVLFDRTGDGNFTVPPVSMKAVVLLVLLFRNVCGTPVPDVMNQNFFSARAGGGRPGAGRHDLVAQYLDGQAFFRA